MEGFEVMSSFGEMEGVEGVLMPKIFMSGK